MHLLGFAFPQFGELTIPLLFCFVFQRVSKWGLLFWDLGILGSWDPGILGSWTPQDEHVVSKETTQHVQQQRGDT